MEWIRISENKLKIMLSAEDAQRYALRCESVDLADGCTRQAFRDILSDIRPATGFDTAEEKVYIQMYPSKEGGCELFVTRMGLLYSDEGEHPDGGSAQKKGSKRAKEPSELPPEPHREAYQLEALDDLLALCARMHRAGYDGESCAFLDEAKKYWLLLSTTEPEAMLCCRPLPASPLLLPPEYGVRRNAAHAWLLLAEHGRCICPVGAIERLGALY